MASKLEALQTALEQHLGDMMIDSKIALNELTIHCKPQDLLAVSQRLKTEASLSFEQCMDVAGMDYSTYRDEVRDGPRFAVVYHLLSIQHNHRLRLRVFCEDDSFPLIPSVADIWSGVNWFEREAFDLYGIVFDGHPDLRRILTDYGFIGHPFRKDFPVSGHVEMRYDAEEQRVVYQPVSIEPREITPRIIREENYGG